MNHGEGAGPLRVFDRAGLIEQAYRNCEAACHDVLEDVRTMGNVLQWERAHLTCRTCQYHLMGDVRTEQGDTHIDLVEERHRLDHRIETEPRG